jgi:uncharacterized protein YaaN involved in tellurite resistance
MNMQLEKTDASQQALTMLEGRDQEKAIQIAKTLATNPKDSTAIISFGSDVQSKTAAFADQILARVRIKDADVAGQALASLMEKCRGMDSKTLSGLINKNVSKLPLFGAIFNKAKAFVARYEKIDGDIKVIVAQLIKAKETAINDIKMLDALTESNIETFKNLLILIAAGEMRLAELNTTIIPQAEAKAKNGSDQLASQDFQNWVGLRDRLERKVHDLKLVQMVILQNLPQVKLIQNNNLQLAEKFDSSISITIPLWKGQIITALALLRGKEGAALQKNVSDTTNNLLESNALLLRQGSVAIAKETERGVVDIATLQKVNEELIGAIDDIKNIKEEGKKNRAAAEVELARMQAQLKEKLTQK